VIDVISGRLLGHLGPLCLALGANGGSISLKFLLETRLQSESFDTLDDLLGSQVQKLCFLVCLLFTAKTGCDAIKNKRYL